MALDTAGADLRLRYISPALMDLAPPSPPDRLSRRPKAAHVHSSRS